MNQIESQSNKLLKHNFYDNIKILLKGLFAYISIAGINISILFLLILLWGKDNLLTINIFLYLIGTLSFLFLFTISTTRLDRNKIGYLSRQIIKRFLDIFLSSFIIFILFPIMILISILIYIDSKGPIIYRSIRLGQNGIPFDLYKFRTMKKLNGKYEITEVGKFIRKLKLDELPVFYNVLIGEMSLIGPRPRFIHNLNQDLNEYKSILSFKPGIISFWQSHANNIFKIDDVLKYDLEYIKNWSLLLDLKIFAKAISQVFFNKK